jgi:hypothetical protein
VLAGGLWGLATGEREIEGHGHGGGEVVHTSVPGGEPSGAPGGG